jgi:hypothetical protein
MASHHRNPPILSIYKYLVYTCLYLWRGSLYLSIPLAWRSIPVYTSGVAFYTCLYLWGGVLYLLYIWRGSLYLSIPLAWRSIPVYTSGVAAYTCLYLADSSLYQLLCPVGAVVLLCVTEFLLDAYSNYKPHLFDISKTYTLYYLLACPIPAFGQRCPSSAGPRCTRSSTRSAHGSGYDMPLIRYTK